MTPELILRWQFAFTVMFHMIFPAITVGLSVFLSIVFFKYWRTGQLVYLQMFRFWRRIFAVGFAIGVVAGIVITFQMGLAWGGFGGKVGPIIGPIIGMEVVTAFFVEAAFIGILLYGDGRVSKGLMFFSSLMVAVGTLLSTTWIIVANTWMQHPVGFETMPNGQFTPTDWGAILFNEALLWRYLHMLVGVFVSAMLFLAGLAAHYARKRVELHFARRTLSIALGILSVAIPLQLAIGNTTFGTYVAPLQTVESVPLDADLLEQGIYKPSPTGEGPTVMISPKAVAAEGHVTQSDNGSYVLAGIFDESTQQYSVVWDGTCVTAIALDAEFSCDDYGIAGLDIVPDEYQPNENAVFWGFRIMFYGSMFVFATAFIGNVLSLRRRLWVSPRYLRWLTWMTPAGLITILGGWVTAETGRQPWVVYGQLTTADAYSHVTVAQALTTFVIFLVLYVGLAWAYIAYIVHTLRVGPEKDGVEGLYPNGKTDHVPISTYFVHDDGTAGSPMDATSAGGAVARPTEEGGSRNPVQKAREDDNEAASAARGVK